MIDPPICGFFAAGLLIAVGLFLYFKNKGNSHSTEERENTLQSESRERIAAGSVRRRAQTGFLFTLAGVAMFAGLRIHPQLHPGLWGGAWTLTFLFLLWGILLTALDLFAVRIRISELNQQKEALRLAANYLNQLKKEGQTGETEDDKTKPE